MKPRGNRQFQPDVTEHLESRTMPATVVAHSWTWQAAHVMKSTVTQEKDVPIPIDELHGTYKGLGGGLYPDGSNQPKGKLADWARSATSRIRPLNGKGELDETNGKIGFLTLGQSTTRMCFEVFQQQIRTVKSGKVKLVNAAQDGVILQHWATTEAPWKKTLEILKKNGLSAKQVQVIWIEVALLDPRQFGDGLKHIQVNADLMGDVARHIKSSFPNVQIMYCSSRYYAGYTTRPTSPEPYAYESAFAIRELIRRQTHHESHLEFNPISVSAQAPLILWGPYYWANGLTPSSVDGLYWKPSDYVPDGVHPSQSGRAKVAAQLAAFFKHDFYASKWLMPPVNAKNVLLKPVSSFNG